MIREPVFRALFVAALLLSGGCASDAIRLSVVRSPLVRAIPQREGVLFVRQLEDARLQQMRRFIGSTGEERAGSPPEWNWALLLEGDQKLGSLLTGYVADALEHVGFETVVQSTTSGAADGIDTVDGIVEGQIEVFWLNRKAPVNWHSVRLSLSFIEKTTGRIGWHRSFESHKTRSSFFPKRADYELIIREALDYALSQMVDAFASDEFYTQLQKSGTTAQ